MTKWGGPSDETEKGDPVLQQEWHDKDLSLLKRHKRLEKAKLLQPFNDNGDIQELVAIPHCNWSTSIHLYRLCFFKY